MSAPFQQELAARLRDRRQQLEQAERELAAISQAASKAASRYSELIEGAGADGHGFHERDEAQRTASDLNAQLGRQRDLVRDLAADADQLEALVTAPEKLRAAINSLRDVRAAAVAAVAARAKIAERVEKLQNQQLAELAAAEVGRAWQQRQILVRLGEAEPDSSPRPEHDPSQCEQAATLIAGMVDAATAERDQIDAEIAGLRDRERQAEADVLAAQALALQVELGAAVAAFAPVWRRFRAAHVVAFGSEPAEVDLAQLGRIDADEAEAEARAVLAAEQPSLLQRAARRVAEAVKA